MRIRALLIALLALPSCKGDFPHYCDEDTPCTSPDRPFCDLDGVHPASNGHGNVCIPSPGDASVPNADGGPGTDADPTVPPAAPTLIAPAYGAFTGSVHAERSLAPYFRWQPTPGAYTYRIQIDDSCPTFGFDDCAFESPEVDATGVPATGFEPDSSLAVDTTPPVGRRYFWRVQACNDAGCGDWSSIRYLNVGRQANDYNGDGYGDILVGDTPSPTPGGHVGSAFVYLGQPNAETPEIIDAPNVTLEDPFDAAGGYYGTTVTSAGDVDADGFADFVIGAPASSGEGLAWLYLGRASWPSTLDTYTTRINLIDDPFTGFGARADGGADINGDGFSDFALGSLEINETAAKGAVHVFFGKPSWTSETAAADLSLRRQSNQEAFAWAISASGDANGDGYGDIVVGAIGSPAQQNDPGRVYLYLGKRNWGTLPVAVDVPDTSLNNPVSSERGRFGSSVDVGDLDGDGYGEVAIGAFAASQPDPVEGNAFIFAGRTSWPSTLDAADVAIDNPNDRGDGHFGYSLSIGDATGDGTQDLLVGATTKEEEGEAFLFTGRSSWPAQVISADAEFLNPSPDGTMGSVVTLEIDWNGDGTTEAVAAAPTLSVPNASNGRIFAWFGRLSWSSAVDTVDFLLSNPNPDETTSGFGNALD